MKNPLELYGESGLQHELALYLKINFPHLLVKLEYPTAKLYPGLRFVKREMDLYVQDGQNKYLIELKMPKLGSGTPNEMYKAIEDVRFAEDLKSAGFTQCYCVLLTNDVRFWQAKRVSGVLDSIFNRHPVTFTSIDAATLQTFLGKRSSIQLSGNHSAHWQELVDAQRIRWKYYILEV